MEASEPDVGIGVLSLGMGWVPGRPGGLNRYVSDLHRALLAAGRDHAVVVYGPVEEVLAGVVDAGREDAPLPKRLYRGYRATRRPADVLVVHFALYGLIPALVGRHRRAPLVVQFHGPWAGESDASGQRSAAVRAKFLIEKLLYRRARRFVVVSHAFAELLSQVYRVPADRIEVIAPGVELDRFTPAEDRQSLRQQLGLPADVPLVAAVRRLVRRTGVDVLLDAWRELDDSGAVLAIAGAGPEAAALQRRSAELGLRNVRWLGEIADKDVVALYQTADVSVVPTRSLEGFGLVVLEALACGTPVVATTVGGLVEVLPSLDPELLVPPENPAALAAALARVLDGAGPDRKACRAMAERYSWREAADRLWSLCEEAARCSR